MTRSCFSFCLVACFVLANLVFCSSGIAQDSDEQKRIAEQRFKQADTDDDGAISKDELAAYVKKKLDWFTRTDELMKRLDKDKDDKISPQEFGNRQKVVNSMIDEEKPEKPTEFADIYNQRFLKQQPLVGDQIKDIVAFDAQGKEFNFKDLRGKYTVLNFGCLT